MRNADGRVSADFSDFMTREMLSEWLRETHAHDELVDAVEALFRERVGVLPRRLRRDLRRFLEDRSTEVLAECLAIHRKGIACDGFAAWCRESAAASDDPYARFGVRPSDFCADRGPGQPD